MVLGIVNSLDALTSPITFFCFIFVQHIHTQRTFYFFSLIYMKNIHEIYNKRIFKCRIKCRQSFVDFA